ncbi:DUF2777 family protein [Halalkalibacter okhensis]|uniref:DUF2777 domain-containing protein n=1 Tax=Halalkalibacter okhensis TaxID=333138 RepID=A0A0B0IHD8_9BACI|nr:DUF2777 family protein [Halalkalibacter okhensis]KHF40277.1 hypothetical protein LQ50_09750 [Halalkalibacter okhensis]
MDRKQAQSNIGNMVKINEGASGTYYGTLQKVIAEPKKPWRGIVVVQGVLELPTTKDKNHPLEIEPLLYKKGESSEFEGGKLTVIFEKDLPNTYDLSVELAVKNRHNEWQEEINTLKTKQDMLLHYFSTSILNSNNLLLHNQKTSEVITYTFHHDGDRFILIDENEERLDLEDCPFTIKWEAQNEKMIGTYERNGVFVSEHGYRYRPKEGDLFMIDREQFDPYVILRNELEPAALSSFEKNLAHFQLTHDDLVDCHNSLLTQLLNTQNQKTFRGANFLQYKGTKGMILVQHHYERTLNDDKNDRIYDRFEFTTDQGKRAIATYTNEYSR